MWLAKLQTAMESIAVSSVEVERLFISAGCFVTRLRTKLDDPMVDTLAFLHSYILMEKKKSHATT